MVRYRLLLLASSLLAGTGGAACTHSNEPERAELRVFAAASLQDAFAALARDFEQRRGDVQVQLSFAGSQVLRMQLERGAAADVFASANVEHMRALVRAGIVPQQKTFAYNALSVIVPRANPAGIAAFEDLPKAKRLVVGTGSVPVGRYTERMLGKAETQFGKGFVARVQRRVVSRESNVRLVRAKVALGEADAAIVYRTDAVASKRVKAVPVPQAVNVRARYTIGRTADRRLARHFLDYVLSEPARSILAQHGFVTEGL